MNGRPYRDPARCVALHATLMACYEACCHALWGQPVVAALGRPSRHSPAQRQAWNRDALKALAQQHDALRSLVTNDPPYCGPDVGPLIAEAQVMAQSLRRYLQPKHAAALHLVMSELWRLATLLRHAQQMAPGDERGRCYAKILAAMAAMQPQMEALTVSERGAAQVAA